MTPRKTKAERKGRHNITLSAAVWRILHRAGKGNRSKAIETLAYEWEKMEGHNNPDYNNPDYDNLDLYKESEE